MDSFTLILHLIFWACLGTVFYAFIGYGLLLSFLVWFRKMVFGPSPPHDSGSYEPHVSLVIPCYNEADILSEKALNCLDLEYPPEKLHIYFITDGSDDHFREVLSHFPGTRILHEARRGGKTAAENRAMKMIKTPIVIFSDANTLLNKKAVRNIVRHFKDDKVGCVSGEKRIRVDEKDSASSAGEGIYWKYESYLKKLDSALYSAVGAAGELVAFRTSLYREIPEDTILDDFMQSMLIASEGYKIVYEPEAYAMETGSLSIREELKRKIRISAGGWQSIQRLWRKITPRKNFTLFFQYVSHRVLRWTVTPFMLIIVLGLNFLLWEHHPLYGVLLAAQVAFYLSASLGYLLEHRKIRLKALFVPYYFCMMNYAVVAGLIRHVKGNQKGIWEKARRKNQA